MQTRNRRKKRWQRFLEEHYRTEGMSEEYVAVAAGEATAAAFRDKWSYLCMALRLLVFPLAALGIMYVCGIRGNVLIVSVLGTSAPVGATTTIFAAKFGRDTELSVRLVSLSTILSLITMPLIVGLTQVLA